MSDETLGAIYLAIGLGVGGWVVIKYLRDPEGPQETPDAGFIIFMLIAAACLWPAVVGGAIAIRQSQKDTGNA